MCQATAKKFFQPLSGVVVLVTVIAVVLVLADESTAVTVIVLVPETKEMSAIDQEAVPLIPAPEVLLAELAQVTEATPTLSEAVPERLTVD